MNIPFLGITVTSEDVFLGVLLGFFVWFFLRYVLAGFFTVAPDERAVKTSFGRAHRLKNATTLDLPMVETLDTDDHSRYEYPQVRVIGPGGPYFRWPWQRVHKISVATNTVNMAWDPEAPSANANGTRIAAVTKDQLNTGLTGEIRYRVAEQNLYAFLFGIKRPIAHVMGFFVAALRQRIANFEAPATVVELELEPEVVLGQASIVDGVSINDLRKNLRDLNDHMDQECRCSAARYGIVLDASLITGIDPPQEVESALAAINTAHNHVSSDISLARASADQRIVQSQRAVEIQTLRAEAEVAPLEAQAEQLRVLASSGPDALSAYRRFVRLDLLDKAQRVIREVKS